MTLSETINTAVHREPCADLLGHRVGTAYHVDGLDGLRDIFGPTDYGPSSDGKVTGGYIFETPRGPAELRDYWWNGPRELSIAAVDHRAGRWLAAYLRRLGIPAHLGMPY